MKKIEFRPNSDKIVREENLKKSWNIPGRRNNHRPVWNVVNNLPGFRDMEIYYFKKNLS